MYEAYPSGDMEGDLERLQDSRDDRVGDMYEAYPMEDDLERLQDPRDLPVRRKSGLHHFHQPQGSPRDVALGAGSAASQWDPRFEPWNNRMAVAPQTPYPRSQMDLGFGPEEYPRGAGGVRTAERVEQKQGEYKSAFAVLAVLFSLVVLAALAYLAKQLLMKRQEDAMPVEAGVGMKTKGPAPVVKGKKLSRFIVEIEVRSGNSNSQLKSPQQSTQPDICKQSGIAATSKKAQELGKQEKNICCCGRAVKLGEL
ncbi:uncharacterized protein [Excalfactoria chinensis]|uniref:uncharacterized protein n=1 Tax=Excalfactoria chinensis TaxID=46218 RepID=UPI003B3AA41C